MPDRFKQIRREYHSAPLSLNALPMHPMVLFDQWLNDAIQSSDADPSAMHLATVNAEGVPSSRIVLLKGVTEEGLEFYTNYNSQKANDIANNDSVCAAFYWPGLCRQIRVTGSASKVSSEKSDQYFATRPRASQISAWASKQSQPQSEQMLAKQVSEIENRFKGELPRPDFWGGYLIMPTLVEFWLGMKNRRHQRFVYQLDGQNNWDRIEIGA